MDGSDLQTDAAIREIATPATNAESPDGAYRVLARKYRPDTFDALIGQDAMVRTLRNAFAARRIAQAWMLTGVRGVGKTTTARILARGLNYDTASGQDAPTVDMPVPGIHCRSIMEGRHPDVVEIDAASHTGIDDIRDIIDSAQYSPVSARFKVYIIDEVHMLSRAAFNGLLKTLEEPPSHVKFVFATTEIRKVPVTVLSRCQRFDLRRIESDVLIPFLASIAEAEGAQVESAALAVIARAAEGSARDALSILDQAIAHSGGVTADRVDEAAIQAMLGLADRARIIDLFEVVTAGQTEAALAELKTLHDSGGDPVVILSDLAAFTHLVTRLKVAPSAAADPSTSEVERTRGADFAGRLSVRWLSRMWQMILAGIDETATARTPLAAAEMVLVRLCHAADLPTPDEALKALERMTRQDRDSAAQASAPVGAQGPAASADGTVLQAEGGAPATGAERPTGSDGPVSGDQPIRAGTDAPSSPGPPAALPQVPAPIDFDGLLTLARDRRDRLLTFALERHVVPLKVEPGRVDLALTPDAEPELPQRLAAALRDWTGSRWVVSVGALPDGAETRHEARAAEEARAIEAARSDPLVASALETFPGSTIVSVRTIALDEATEQDDTDTRRRQNRTE